jgi:lysophospholipase L1-like esterase
MKPFRAFLFLTSVLVLFFLVSFYRLHRNQEDEPVHRPENAASRGSVTGLPEPYITFQPDSTPRLTLADTTGIVQADNAVGSPTAPPVSGLVFAENDTLKLDGVAHKLHRLAAKREKLRILYYGDSQIEGDRITSALRKKLQERYGGHGPGLIAPDQYYNAAHQLIMTTSDNWQNIPIAAMEGHNKSVLFKNALAVAPAGNNWWFRINRLKFLHPQADYQQVRFFYYASDSVSIQCLDAAHPVYSENTDATPSTASIGLNFDQTPEDLKIEFSTNDSLWITGLSLDSPWGVFVDNIALRGRAYPPFSDSSPRELKTMMDQLHPDLFILQFGVNVVPYYTEGNHAFKQQLTRQIHSIRKLCPQIPIIIVGVSDMAQRIDGEFQSYQNIAEIKQVQQEIAASNNCIFWDLEQFMGGSGSMVRWVNANPPLGRKDYIHFSKPGSEKIGNEIARLLIREFENQQQLAWTNN